MNNLINTIFKKDILELNKQSDRVEARTANVSWPSEAMADLGLVSVGECKRNVFYKILGVKPTETPSIGLRYVCDAGLLYEHYHIQRFKNLGMYKSEQVKFEFSIPGDNSVIMSCKLDLIIEQNKSQSAIEIKSVSAYKAEEVFGSTSKLPLPFPNNLMQTMIYKYYFSQVPAGTGRNIDDVYILYVNRSDGSTFWYKIDIDQEGYPIITAYDITGKETYVLETAKYPTFEEILKGNNGPDYGRIAERRINIRDIFKKFDLVYTYARQASIPPKDYKLVYEKEDMDTMLAMGRITKQKYSRFKNGTSSYGDFKCTVCPYLKQCLKDSGIVMKDVKVSPIEE